MRRLARMARRRRKRSTTGPSRVAAQTIKKRESAQILAGSKLPEKRNKREIRGALLAALFFLLDPFVLSPPRSSLSAPNAMDRSSRLLF